MKSNIWVSGNCAHEQTNLRIYRNIEKFRFRCTKRIQNEYKRCCDSVQEMINASSLLFHINETAFSVQIQIRKKFIEGINPSDKKFSTSDDLKVKLGLLE